MAAPVRIRGDFSSAQVRAFARRAKDGCHVRRLLAISTILDGGSRSDAARENVWQFMRDNWLSNRIFSPYDNVVDHSCHAWNRLIDQPSRIMSVGLRQWAHGA